MPIKEIAPTGTIATRNGEKSYNNKVSNGVRPSLQFICENGYQITTTDDHNMETFDYESGSWRLKRASDVRHGDFFRLALEEKCEVENFHQVTYPSLSDDVRSKRYNMQVVVDENYGEFIGLMLADGVFTNSGLRLAKRNPEVRDRFSELSKILFGVIATHQSHRIGNGGDFFSSNLNSKFIKNRLWGSFPELRPKQKSIPRSIMQSPLSVQKAFLRGVFEDGTVNMKGDIADHIELYNESDKVVEYIHILLLKCGVVSTIAKKKDKPDGSVLYIYSKYMTIFAKEIGFISYDKINRSLLGRDTDTRNRIPITATQAKEIYEKNVGFSRSDYSNAKIRGYVTKEVWNKCGLGGGHTRWHCVRVKEINHCEEESMCVSVPDDGTFIQNGFSHGNCQGSEAKNIIVYDEDVSFFLEQRRYRYSACTRAKTNLLVVS